MDNVALAFYELRFKVSYMERTGSEFQDFFCDIMEKCHPGDFIRCRPWGRDGDRKNDGYLSSERRLFAVYAPNDMEENATLAKVDSDFSGALPYWQQYFDKWAFVHNSRRGLSPGVTRRLLELHGQHPEIEISSWGFEELRQKAFALGPGDLASLLGPPVSRRDMIAVGFSALGKVLSVVARAPHAPDGEVRAVPPGKLDANGLSGSVKMLLRAGMSRCDRVQAFLAQSDPKLGDEVAGTFKRRYEELHASEADPDVIFQQLQFFAGGGQGGTPDHEAAVLAVLAYLFEQCEIFEAPLTEEQA